MQAIVLNAGIDVSKDKLDVYMEYLFGDRSTKKAGKKGFNNTGKGIEDLLVWIDQRNKLKCNVHVTLEATGRYHENVAYGLVAHNFAVSIVLPNRIKYFARSLNQFSKTDDIDAKMIAAYTTLHKPELWRPANASMRQLKELTRERQGLVKSKTIASNRLHAIKRGRHPLAATVDRLEAQIEFYQNHIEAIETDIKHLRRQDPKLDEDISLLCTIPHIGWLTACIILAETGGFVLFKSRSQLIKYAGLDIIERLSGSSVRGKSKISKRGNSHLRSAPFMGALSATNMDTVFSNTYVRHLEKSGITKKAQSAVIRQLLKVAYGVFKSRQEYCAKEHQLRVKKGVDELNSSPTVAHSID